MNKAKIFRIIKGNGLKPENFESIDDNGHIYVFEDGIRYELINFTKKIVEENKTSEDEISDEDLTDILTTLNESEQVSLSEDELKRIKAIKKPRGWHFKDEFIDSEGNIYHKGVLVL